MRIPSGTTDQYIYFVAVDSTDFTSRETGLSSFTVYRSRNGGAAAAMTTPTINEVSAANMPGVYELLLDEDMTIDSGDDSQEMAFHITHAGMAPVTRTIELYRPKITVGNTLTVESDGDLNQVNFVNGLTVASISDAVWTDALSGYSGTAGSTAEALAAILADTNELQTDDVPGLIAALNDPTAAAIADAVWEEAIADHSGTAGSTAEALNAAGSAGDPWTTTLPGSYTGSQAGKILSDILTDTGTTLDTNVSAIKAVTDNLPDSGALSSLPTADKLLAYVQLLARTDGAIQTDRSTELAEINADEGSGAGGYDNTGDSLESAEVHRLSQTTLLSAIQVDTDELQTDLTDGGRLDLILDAILADTNELQTDDVPGLIAALNDLDSTAVQTACNAALVALHLDHLLAADYDPASKPGTSTALLNELVENDGGVSRFTANALEQAPSGGGGGDATEANQTTIIGHLTDIKGGTWSGTTDTLESIYNNLPVGSGTGAYVVTVNVKDDGASNLQNATVRMIEGANEYVATTNASGNASFALDSATYTVSITKDGYTDDDPGGSVVVSGAGTFNRTMTGITIPSAPADGSLCRVYGYVKNIDDSAASGVAITITLMDSKTPYKEDEILAHNTITLTTDVNGDIPPTDLKKTSGITPKGSYYLVNCTALGIVNRKLILTSDTYDLSNIIT